MPVILVTGMVDPEITEVARERGAFACVEKPFDVAALDHVIRAALGSRTG